MREIPAHLIKKAFEMYRFHTEGNGIEPDELQFVSGAAAMVGLLVGTLDVGIPEGTQSFDVLAQLVREVDKYRAEIAALEEQAKQRSNRRNQ